MQPISQETFNYLSQNPFKNIVLLKMLQAYPDAITCHRVNDIRGHGVLLLLQTRASSYDSKTYPNTRYVVLMSSSNAWAATALAAHIPIDQPLIFKLNTEHDHAALASQFQLQRITSFISFTHANDSPPTYKHNDAIQISPTLDINCLPLFAQQGYDEADMEHYFGHNNAYCIAYYQQNQPIAACFTYQNYSAIWEIGGVYTLPTARKQGYGRQVVAAALKHLQQNHLKPRYQAHEQNTASIQLALSLHLQPALSTTHWLLKSAMPLSKNK